MNLKSIRVWKLIFCKHTINYNVTRKIHVPTALSEYIRFFNNYFFVNKKCLLKCLLFVAYAVTRWIQYDNLKFIK